MVAIIRIIPITNIVGLATRLVAVDAASGRVKLIPFANSLNISSKMKFIIVNSTSALVLFITFLLNYQILLLKLLF